ncbi:VOC family protein [Caldibacillus debilis]|uniref:VOC domain-containing protein n=1 Tax=Caldibacillus debilis TaxID=301148 RepID=A0A150L7L9_9BACI|nr:VOC family protein [Caldibacillus debilis]KYD08308.1 hypothetical protein B4135_4019 [Caldibacillus debilis]
MKTFSVSKISSVVLHVKDTKVSAEFYGKVLGLKKTDEYDGMVWFLIGEGENVTPLMLHPSEKPNPVTAGLSVDFSVDDVDALVSAVKSAGIGRVVQEPVDREWGVREAIIEDPDGYQFWCNQPLNG